MRPSPRVLLLAAVASLTLGASDPTAISRDTAHDAPGRNTTVEHPRSGYVWPYSSPPRIEDPAAPLSVTTRIGEIDLAHPLTARLDPALRYESLDETPYAILVADPALEAEALAELERSLEAHGGRVVRPYGAPHLAIVRLDAAARRWAELDARIRVVEPYHPALKLHPAIGRLPLLDAERAAASTYLLDVSLFPGEPVAPVAARVRALGGRVESTRDDGRLRIRIDREALAALAAHPAIESVIEPAEVRPAAEESTVALQVGSGHGPASPFHEAGVDGGGGGQAPAQVLMVLDTGIQLDAADLSDTRTSAGTPGPSHRKVVAYETTAAFGGGGDLVGCDNPVQGASTHGHIVSAVALGAATRVDPASYGNPWLAEDPEQPGSFFRLDGVAPGARLAAYDAQLTRAVGSCSDTFQGVLDVGTLYSAPGGGSLAAAHDSHGARVFNFSWGRVGNAYDGDAEDADDFLIDHPEATLVVAAGNGGGDGTGDDVPDPFSIGSPGSTKNAIVVGSSGHLDDGGDPRNLDERSAFSGVGPVGVTGRVAPLVMAPGEERGGSGIASQFGCRTSDNDSADPVECDIVNGLSGTSYASAAVAGAALLIRDYFAQGFHPDGRGDNPGNAADRIDVAGGELSGALVKAILVASSEFIGREFRGSAGPDNLSFPQRFNREQGYGRVQLDRVLPLANWAPSPSSLLITDGGVPGGRKQLPIAGLVTPSGGGSSGNANFRLCDPTQELRIALAWTDPSGDALVNDLDLTVTAPDGRVYWGNYFTDDNNRDGAIVGGEDCPGFAGQGGTLDAGAWSLPTCANSLRDGSNPTEAVFLSPDPDGDGTLDDGQGQTVTGNWLINVKHNGGLGASNQPYALVVAGGACDASSVALDAERYTCSDELELHVNELIDAADPLSPLDAADVASRVTLEVVAEDRCADAETPCDGDADCGGIGDGICRDEQVVDREVAPALFRSDPTSFRFSSLNPMLLTDRTAFDEGNGVLDVRDGMTVRALYQDDDGAGGAEPGDLLRVAEAAVDCRVGLSSGGVVFSQFGIDTSYDIIGGCERNLRGRFEFGFPDLYLDAGELVSYRFAFSSADTQTTFGATASLRCVVADADSPQECLPGSGDCADPDRLNNPVCPWIEILDDERTIDVLPAGAATATAFTVAVSETLSGTPTVEMVLELRAELDGRTAVSRAINRHRLNVDAVSLFYSTDFPTGGSQIVDVNNNEHAEDPTTDPTDLQRDYFFETRSWSDLTAGGTVNQGLQSPWNFDANDGGFRSGLATESDRETIASIVANWGEDENFDGVMTGRCTDDATVTCGRFPIDVLTCPSGPANFACEPLEDRDPVNNPVARLDQNWSTSGGCGWQTIAPLTCIGGANANDPCYTDADCPSGSCGGAAPSGGGVWHTGRIDDRADSATNPDNCLFGLGAANGDCQSYETVAGADGQRLWAEMLLTPVIEKVNQDVDGEGADLYTAEILNWGWNQAIDLADEFVIVTWEFDNDVDRLEPASLIADLDVLNFASGAYGSVTASGNPSLTDGYGVFAPLDKDFNDSVNGSRGENRQGVNSCFFENGNIPFASRDDLGLAGPPDDDLLNGYCDGGDGDRNRSCSFVCDGDPSLGCNESSDCNGTCQGSFCTNDPGRSCATNLQCQLGTCVDADPACDGDSCVRGSAALADIDRFVSANGPIRNFDISDFNGIDGRLNTISDVYGPAGNRFQGAIGFLTFESDSAGSPPQTGFGLAVDDVVVEWREFRLDEDVTSCAGGACAVVEVGNVNSFVGSGLVELQVLDASPYGAHCQSAGSCSIGGGACDGPLDCDGDPGDADPENGLCVARVCFDNADCANSDCAVTANDCDGNEWFFDVGDDGDCNDDGTPDVVVVATSGAELAGERVVLDRDDVNPVRYAGTLALSAALDVPGTLFLAQQGTAPEQITVSYRDIDDGTGLEPCRNSVDGSGDGTVQAFASVFLPLGNVVVTDVLLADNGDQDGFADDDETVTMRLEVLNNTGIDLDDVVLRVATNSPFIDCVTDNLIDLGPLAAGEARLSDDTAAFRVGTVGRTDVEALAAAEFTVTASAAQFVAVLRPQSVTLDLDLDASGGSGPGSYLESFESGFLASFSESRLDEGLGSPAASDRYRCQYNDPDWVNSNSTAVPDCYLNPTGGPDLFYWQVTDDRAYSGTRSLYFGVDLGSSLGFTTPLGQLEAVESDDPINLGWDSVCSVTRTTSCGDAGDCPVGEECVAASPRLTFKHQVSLVDTRTVNANIGQTADRAVVMAQLADAAGNPVGDWMKLEPIVNVYDQQAADNFTNCTFDPIDDGNDEDDFFDPTDPDRRSGPSSTCFPEFVFSNLGDTDGAYTAFGLGNAGDGPALEGATGDGSWVESIVDLDRFRGRRLRLRFLVSTLKIGGFVTYESAFAPFNPDPGDDGWWIDDIAVSDTLAAAASVAPDLKDNGALPSCGAACTLLDAELVASPAISPVPGRAVELDAFASAADRCSDGTLQYRFWRDLDANGLPQAGVDRLLRDYTDAPTLLVAPESSSTYLVEVRCSSEPACADVAVLPLVVECPSTGSVGGLFQQVDASSQTSLGWPLAVETLFARGSLATLPGFGAATTGNAGVVATFDISADQPGPGAGFWYLFRGTQGGGATACNALATWSSGGIGEAGGRDASLP